ncbi:regulatory LuxR family protein [Enterobacter sp. BIGb0383]|uniref:helix-turn-helix transcriptional regulator n=1 Tax=unclassified Enterobacter TaxID=2608935 RepID=UPI000F49D189|nr:MULTISPECIES: helix-turn-helix transcriptional regulator [unclassified Enterobacter]ROP59986.1 regulatory LuxR family protein [Enterobacter sp. BIGb0383]ROS08545.1 regulatory LuxR family protein [Enterobacter sp. BIGb0359]
MTYRDDVLILSQNDNYYLMNGLIAIIRSVMGPETHLRISDDFSAAGISQADIIVMNSPSLLLYFCHPNFRFRKPHSVLISLHNKQGILLSEDLPSCFQDIIIVRRDEARSRLRTRLTQRLMRQRAGTSCTFSPPSCARCRCRHLSRNQLQIVKYLRQGYSIQCIARILRVSAKTVYTHKYRLMEKFDARGDAELNQFINLLGLDDSPAEHHITDSGIKLI